MRWMSVWLALVGCGSTGDDGGSGTAGPTGLSSETLVSTTSPSLSEPSTDASVDRCRYTNPFSQGAECKEYTGSGWTMEAAEADCAAPVPGAGAGIYEPGLACDRDAYLGTCEAAAEEGLDTITVFPGTDAGACGGAELGCTFLGGTFTPTEACDGDEEPEGVASADAFVPFQQVCIDPLPGDPAGDGPGGQVCTWEAVSGATEEGRRFVDYASCEPIFSQRPYYPYEVSIPVDPADDRLDDPAWVEEFGWVTSQFEATSCSCCHSDTTAPSGPSGWSLDDEPVWLDGVDDDGLAMLAGWVDSTAFGAFAPEDNNGFDRSTTGVPTTDVARMVSFLESELARRGLYPEDFVDTPPFGGPLYDQLVYEPGPCGDGQGLGADGTLSWTGGPARYVYVMQADSDSPGVPPNLDLPDGTLWRLDVDYTAEPVPSGVRYGDAPPGTRVAYPSSGEAPALQPGERYYLVALLDVYQPATRCLFVAP